MTAAPEPRADAPVHTGPDAGGGLLGRPEGRGDAGVRAGVDGLSLIHI